LYQLNSGNSGCAAQGRHDKCMKPIPRCQSWQKSCQSIFAFFPLTLIKTGRNLGCWIQVKMAWRGGVVYIEVSSQPTAERTGAMGHEI
jgi:hypothetical protein